MYNVITNVIIENNDFIRSTVNAISDNMKVLRIEYIANYGNYTTQRTNDLVSLYNHLVWICVTTDLTLDKVTFTKVFVVDEYNKGSEF